MARLSPRQRRRIAWWQKARFGMFVHWGLYTAGGLDCWKMHNMGIPTREYIDALEGRFTGKNFDARALVGLAKESGCRYVVMGARHHEGYCLWDTDTTKFSSARMTPKRDFIAEYVRAARGAGLRVGLYYSLLDWRYQAYWDGPRKNPAGWREFVDVVHAQVRELMTRYGRIDILWYDGAWPPDSLWHDSQRRVWRSQKLNAAVRKLQPGILINNRAGIPEDFNTPEQKIEPSSRPWELCDTLGDLWGASPADLNRKTARAVINRLILCVSRSGNMLLNIGPKADGGIQAWQRRIMQCIGGWLKIHGEAIYGCVGEWQSPLLAGLAPWRVTRKGKLLYLHLLRYPGESFSIGNQHDNRIVSATLIDTGRPLKVRHEATRDVISGLPKKSPDPIAAVIKVTTRSLSGAERRARRSIALADPEAALR